MAIAMDASGITSLRDCSDLEKSDRLSSRKHAKEVSRETTSTVVEEEKEDWVPDDEKITAVEIREKRARDENRSSSQ